MDDEAEVVEGSGNVFADLELPDADEELVRAQLTYQVHAAVKARGLTRAQAAELLGLGQPQAAMLMRNRPGSLSLARLMRLLTALGLDVQITLRPKAPGRESGRVRVVVQEAGAAHP